MVALEKIKVEAKSPMQKLVLSLVASVVVHSLVAIECRCETFNERVASASSEGKTTYVMFYRASNSATNRMARTVHAQVSASADRATWVKVNVNDPSGAALVERFDAKRIPLPTVFGLAPNGAVTGVFRQNVTRQKLTQATLTQKHAELVKALQQQKIAILCVQPPGVDSIPAGVEQFENDPDFQGKTFRVVAYTNEQGEQEMFNRMNVSSQISSPVCVVFAPPGVHIGTFDGSVAGSAIAAKLHDSGKCNCAKCQQRRRR